MIRLHDFRSYEKEALKLGSYWKCYEERWNYYRIAMLQLAEWDVETLLEIGPKGLPCSPNSDTVDKVEGATFLHDVREPWPFADNQYDAVVGLQVWEHLEGEQQQAFQEARRVGKRLILSFPYLWETGDEIHRDVSLEQIMSWVCHERPFRDVIVCRPGKRRIVMAWK